MDHMMLNEFQTSPAAVEVSVKVNSNAVSALDWCPVFPPHPILIRADDDKANNHTNGFLCCIGKAIRINSGSEISTSVRWE